MKNQVLAYRPRKLCRSNFFQEQNFSYSQLPKQSWELVDSAPHFSRSFERRVSRVLASTILKTVFLVNGARYRNSPFSIGSTRNVHSNVKCLAPEDSPCSRVHHILFSAPKVNDETSRLPLEWAGVPIFLRFFAKKWLIFRKRTGSMKKLAGQDCRAPRKQCT